MNKQQEEINEGQRKINGALCYVDWHVIKAIKTLTDVLVKNGVLRPQDVQELNQALTELYATSNGVAGIEPPGCNPNFYSGELRDVQAA